MRWAAVVFMLPIALAAHLAANEEPIEPAKLPKTVVEAVKKRFPDLTIQSASKEKDGEKTNYEVTMKKAGKRIEATVSEAGSISLIEEEIDFKDLPKAVATTFAKEFPKAKFEIIESVTTIANGRETLQYYEATLEVAGNRWEVELLPDGKLKSAKKTD